MLSTATATILSTIGRRKSDVEGCSRKWPQGKGLKVFISFVHKFVQSDETHCRCRVQAKHGGVLAALHLTERKQIKPNTLKDPKTGTPQKCLIATLGKLEALFEVLLFGSFRGSGNAVAAKVLL